MPPISRVYADFNAIEHQDVTEGYSLLPLTGYGTLASLSRQKLRLTERQQLVLFEPNDVECDATVYYAKERAGPAGILGEWVAQIKKNAFRDCTGDEELSLEHPCFGCGLDLETHQPAHWRSYHEICAKCGTPVMAPLAPPPSAA
jgi:hypothetical protein